MQCTIISPNCRGETVPGGESLMHELPRSVREDVSMEECSMLLDNIPVFRHVDPSFLRQVSLAMSAYVFAPRDIVLYSGDMGREIYCIQRGNLEVSISAIILRQHKVDSLLLIVCLSHAHRK